MLLRLIPHLYITQSYSFRFHSGQTALRPAFPSHVPLLLDLLVACRGWQRRRPAVGRGPPEEKDRLQRVENSGKDQEEHIYYHGTIRFTSVTAGRTKKEERGREQQFLFPLQNQLLRPSNYNARWTELNYPSSTRLYPLFLLLFNAGGLRGRVHEERAPHRSAGSPVGLPAAALLANDAFVNYSSFQGAHTFSVRCARVCICMYAHTYGRGLLEHTTTCTLRPITSLTRMRLSHLRPIQTLLLPLPFSSSTTAGKCLRRPENIQHSLASVWMG